MTPTPGRVIAWRRRWPRVPKSSCWPTTAPAPARSRWTSGVASPSCPPSRPGGSARSTATCCIATGRGLSTASSSWRGRSTRRRSPESGETARPGARRPLGGATPRRRRGALCWKRLDLAARCPERCGGTSGAGFGVVVGQSFGLGLTFLEAAGLTAFAFAGALLAAGAVYLIAAVGRGLSVQTLLLAGVIVGIFFSSAITVVISLLDFNRLGGVIHWLLGNLAPIPPGALGLFALFAVVGFWLVVSHARELNLMALGEETALLLGVGAERLKLTIFVGAALLTASVVAFTGPIGFVGLIVPHALRMLLGSDNRLLVPASLVGGGIFLLLSDTVARNLVAPAELSVGVITSLCGAPFFIYLLRSRVTRIGP